MQSYPIYFVTSNQAKLNLLAQVVVRSDITKFKWIPISLDIQEIQSMDNSVVSSDKVIQAYRHIRDNSSNQTNWVMCEDTGYSFANMGNFPGALVKFYHDSIGVSGICKFHAGTRVTNTSCVAITNGKTIWLFSNQVTGTVPDQPRTTHETNNIIESDDLEKIFIPDYAHEHSRYQGLALSEVPVDIKLQYSARAKSFAQLANWFDQIDPDELTLADTNSDSADPDNCSNYAIAKTSKASGTSKAKSSKYLIKT